MVMRSSLVWDQMELPKIYPNKYDDPKNIEFQNEWSKLQEVVVIYK